MNITTQQYREGKKGCFLSSTLPAIGESLTLIMPTGRGKRHVPVGDVANVEAVGNSRFLVWPLSLPPVEGMDY
ncbi:hypothetical protein [Kosakonia sacchari]|uniref:hypothetical protein n=1 Tax=Kosakonia sacchari TaxID=1158459 RepID=UPI001584C05A|nr:hypothetical protein [Kosakonia sacchari]NUL35072.1 hypothetical protein [Kosakonia sacchari]